MASALLEVLGVRGCSLLAFMVLRIAILVKGAGSWPYSDRITLGPWSFTTYEPMLDRAAVSCHFSKWTSPANRVCGIVCWNRSSRLWVKGCEGLGVIRFESASAERVAHRIRGTRDGILRVSPPSAAPRCRGQ